ncbi:MAG: DUF2442 domain-containing protein [Mangrovibacterium sp.]
MRIVENYTEQVPVVIRVSSAKYIGDFAVRISFSDGSERLVDFKPFLMNSRHPSVQKYLEESIFRNFNVVDGNLNWNDYDLIFPVWDLYNGKISA